MPPKTVSKHAAQLAPAPATAADKRHALKVVRRLKKAYPDSACSLHHRNAFELLVATILSAQCTDERVNLVTRPLFRKYRSAAALARVAQEELEEAIHSTGFFRNKARAIRGMAQMVVDDFGGQVPNTMEELLRLPGVARKTANVVMGNAFGIAAGVVVDTHVHRITQLLGMADAKDTNKVEARLMALLPRAEWVQFSHRLIDHGRAVCIARRPRCGECVLADVCPSAAV